MVLPAPIVLRARYALSGTETAYGAASSLSWHRLLTICLGTCHVSYRPTPCPVLTWITCPIVLRALYAVSGTDIGLCRRAFAMQSPVLEAYDDMHVLCGGRYCHSV
eukprot:2590908-Rhodomonas_salina.1